MKLYLLERISNDLIYDNNDGHIIRAKSAKRARELAQEVAADEGPIWEDLQKVSCKAVTYKGEEGFILTDFQAG